ncbi:MAG: hypothetical protein UHN02_06720 [Acutalibacteraceae bacterium]|nr:hypothetical protein [Acutalibacteraceae bacterium]
MREEIDNLSLDQIEDFGASQKDSIWGQAPSVDPNVLTVEEIMGKHPDGDKSKEFRTKINEDNAPTKEIKLSDYEDVSSSTDLSDAAMLVIEKMRAANSNDAKKEEKQSKVQSFKVNIDDSFFSDDEQVIIPKTAQDTTDSEIDKNLFSEPELPQAEQSKTEHSMTEQPQVEQPQAEHPDNRDFKLEIDLDQTVADYEPPVEKQTVEQNTVVIGPEIKIKNNVNMNNGATNIFNTSISANRNSSEENHQEENKQTVKTQKENIDDPEELLQVFLSQRLSLRIKSVITFFVTLIMLGVAVFKPFEITDSMYYYVTGGLLIIAMLVNYKIIGALSTVFKKIPNTDCSSALAAVFSLIQLVICYTQKDKLGETFGYFSFFGFAACTSMLFASLGKLSITKRIILNLKALQKNKVHNATVFIAPPYSAKFADIQQLGETLICARREADNLQGFLHYSLALDPYEQSYLKSLIISVSLASLSGLAYGLVSSSVVMGVSLATAVFCLFAPFATLMVNGFGISSICKLLRKKGAVLSGYAAAEEIGNANVIELEATELFDGDTVNLFNFKTFDEYPFQKAIAQAAAITQAVNSPLAGMFNKIVATNKVALPEVDNVEHEEKMGVTGWINDKKTIIGNRMVMESHNVPVPPLDFDKKIIMDGKFPVYFAVDGQLTAVFIVGYSVKKQMVMRIRKLVNTGVTMLVRTTDPNITESLICSKYGIPEDSVIIMTSSAANYYAEITEKAQAEPAMLVARNARGFIDAYIQSINAKQIASLASVIVFIGCIVLSVLSIALTFLGYLNMITALTVVIVHILGMGVVSFINTLRA